MKKMIKDTVSFVLIMAMIIYSGLLTIAVIENWKYGNPEFEIAIESEYNPEYKDYEVDESDEEYDRESDEFSYSYSL